jgi:hypothetical protein
MGVFMWLWDYVKQEPVAAQGVVQAVLALGTSFGFGLTGEQVGGLLAVTAAILTLVTRQTVTPLANPRNNNNVQLVPKSG